MLFPREPPLDCPPPFVAGGGVAERGALDGAGVDVTVGVVDELPELVPPLRVPLSELPRYVGV